VDNSVSSFTVINQQYQNKNVKNCNEDVDEADVVENEAESVDNKQRDRERINPFDIFPHSPRGAEIANRVGEKKCKKDDFEREWNFRPEKYVIDCDRQSPEAKKGEQNRKYFFHFFSVP